MERELFRMIRSLLRMLGRRRLNRRFVYTDASILEVYYWAVLHDRPVSWACLPEHWPAGARRGPLPSQSQVSRRLRTPRLRQLCKRLELRALRHGRSPQRLCILDGKALAVPVHSTDPHARFGRGTGGTAKGYKLHALIDRAGVVWAWRVAAMNADERTIARRLLRDLPECFYVLADSNYDANRLFELTAKLGAQFVAPRRQTSRGRGLGHCPHHPARLRSRDMLENGVSDYGVTLLRERRAIERYFSSLGSFGGGMHGLPPWVRTYHRVHAYVQTKLIIRQLRTDFLLASKHAA